MPLFVEFQAIVIGTIVVAFILELVIPPIPLGKVPIAWSIYRTVWGVLFPIRQLWSRLTGTPPPSRPHPRVRVPLSFAAAFFYSWLAIFVIFAPWLTVLQLAVAWTTFAVLNALRMLFRTATDWKEAEERSAKQLKQLGTDLDERTRRSVEAALDGAAEVIRGRAHRRALENAVDDAQRTLCIVSGWINDRAVDDRLLVKIEEAAGRGVRVFVGFGYNSRAQHDRSDGKDLSTQKAVIPLAMIGEKHAVNGRPAVSIGWIGTHEKVIVVDDAYVIVGSNNWLSNSSYVNAETSVRHNNRKLAREFGHDIALRVSDQPFDFRSRPSRAAGISMR